MFIYTAYLDRLTAIKPCAYYRYSVAPHQGLSIFVSSAQCLTSNLRFRGVWKLQYRLLQACVKSK